MKKSFVLSCAEHYIVYTLAWVLILVGTPVLITYMIARTFLIPSMSFLADSVIRLLVFGLGILLLYIDLYFVIRTAPLSSLIIGTGWKMKRLPKERACYPAQPEEILCRLAAYTSKKKLQAEELELDWSGTNLCYVSGDRSRNIFVYETRTLSKKNCIQLIRAVVEETLEREKEKKVCILYIFYEKIDLGILAGMLNDIVIRGVTVIPCLIDRKMMLAYTQPQTPVRRMDKRAYAKAHNLSKAKYLRSHWAAKNFIARIAFNNSFGKYPMEGTSQRSNPYQCQRAANELAKYQLDLGDTSLREAFLIDGLTPIDRIRIKFMKIDTTQASSTVVYYKTKQDAKIRATAVPYSVQEGNVFIVYTDRWEYPRRQRMTEYESKEAKTAISKELGKKGLRA